MTEYAFRPIKYHVYRVGDNPIFGESVTELSIEDEAGGPFLMIRQHENDFGPGGTLRINFDEIPTLLEAIALLTKEAREIEQENA